MNTRIIAISDHAQLIEFWRGLEGVSVGFSDEREPFSRYLQRNPNSNFLVEKSGRIIATALAAHDGRRGMLRHVAVAAEFRGQGIARALVEKCISTRALDGIQKSYIIVYSQNERGRKFWQNLGWESSDEFSLMWLESKTPT